MEICISKISKDGFLGLEEFMKNKTSFEKPHRASKFDGKEVDIKLDAGGKEWFCGKDVCEVLGFKNANDVLLKQVKQAYKTDLKSMHVTCGSHVNPAPYHAGKSVYISESDI